MAIKHCPLPDEKVIVEGLQDALTISAWPKTPEDVIRIVAKQYPSVARMNTFFHKETNTWYIIRGEVCVKCKNKPADIDDYGVTLCNDCLAKDPAAKMALAKGAEKEELMFGQGD